MTITETTTSQEDIDTIMIFAALNEDDVVLADHGGQFDGSCLIRFLAEEGFDAQQIAEAVNAVNMARAEAGAKIAAVLREMLGEMIDVNGDEYGEQFTREVAVSMLSRFDFDS